MKMVGTDALPKCRGSPSSYQTAHSLISIDQRAGPQLLIYRMSDPGSFGSDSRRIVATSGQ